MGRPHRMQCALTVKTTAVSRRCLCPRLPTPPWIEPANRDALQTKLSDCYSGCSRLKLKPPDPPEIRFVDHQYLCSSRRYLPSPPVHLHPLQFCQHPSLYSQLLLATVSTCTVSLNFWYIPVDEAITEHTGVYPRHLTHMSHVLSLSVGAPHTDSDGIVTTLSVRRYNNSCNLEGLSAADRTCQSYQQSNLQRIYLCLIRRNI